MALNEGNFEISPLELKELMSRRREDAVLMISELGGLDEIARQMKTDLQRGISLSSRPKDLDNRQSHFGVNVLPIPYQEKSLARTVCESCLFAVQDKLLVAFIAIAIISMILGLAIEPKKEFAWLEGAVILASVLIIVVITSVHEFKRYHQREAATDVMGDKAVVIRDGRLQEIPVEQLVVGDIVQINSESESVPADGILIQGNCIRVDESNLTGEPDLIAKNNDRDPILLAGTRVMEGEGTILVSAVGPHSQQGIIVTLMSQQPEEEQKGVCSRLCSCFRDWLCCKGGSPASGGEVILIQRVLLGCGIVASLICVLALSLWFAISEFSILKRSWNTSTDLPYLLQFVFLGIAVVVVTVPEGILIAVPLALGYSIKKINQDGNVVRRIDALRLAEVTSLIVEKTGILTTNQFTVVESYFAGKHYTGTVVPKRADLPDSLLEVLNLVISVNSDYNSKLEPIIGHDRVKYAGNLTQCALLAFLKQLGTDYEAVRGKYPKEQIVKVFPLQAATMNRSTVIQMPGGGYRVLTTGVAEVILHKCTQVVDESGKVSTLGDERRREIMENAVHPMVSGAQRVLALAYRDIPISTNNTPDWEDSDDIVSNLILIGITGIQDPLKPEVSGCIKSLHEAGITVRMATGDNIQTARAIAEKCGIINSKWDDLHLHLALDRKEFNEKVMDVNGEVVQQKLDGIWPQLRVLAGCSPTDKYNLVLSVGRRRCKEVVAFIGRETSDAVTMKVVDIGIAMGSERTDVVDGACDIIIPSDDFTSVMKAVMYCRSISASLSRFLQFQLTVNIVAILLTTIAAVTIGESPLKAIHLLWINLIMDALAALALCMEPPTAELLKRKSYGKNKPLISKQMWVFMVGHSIYQLIVLLVILFAGPVLFDFDSGVDCGLRSSQHFTLVFNTFVMMLIFNEINARKVHSERNVFSGIWQNWVFLVIVIIQIIIQVIIVQFGDDTFHTTGLYLDLWLWCVFLGGTELLIGQLLTLIPLNFLAGRFSSSTPVGTPDPITDDDTSTNRAKLRWLNSTNQLRTQIRVVNAFRAGIGSSTENSTLQSGRYRQLHVTGIETTV